MQAMTVTPLACVPECGKLSHCSERSPERVIHCEAMREPGSDELIELPNTSATQIGPRVRHSAHAGPQKIQLPTSIPTRDALYARGPDDQHARDRIARMYQHAR